MAAAPMSAPTPLLDVSMVSPLEGQRNRQGDYAQSSCPMTGLLTPRQLREAQPSQKWPITPFGSRSRHRWTAREFEGRGRQGVPSVDRPCMLWDGGDRHWWIARVVLDVL